MALPVHYNTYHELRPQLNIPLDRLSLHGPPVESYGGAFFYERGTPVSHGGM